MEGFVVEGYVLLVAIMAAGFVTGLLLRERHGAIRRVERLARPVIFVLLFVMGVGTGMDEQTMVICWP